MINELFSMDCLYRYTSSIPPRPCNGVFGFSFSQPVDDPKNYCYLWVMYGKAGLEMGHSNVELYCIEFQDKPALGNLGYIYKVSWIFI